MSVLAQSAPYSQQVTEPLTNMQRTTFTMHRLLGGTWGGEMPYTQQPNAHAMFRERLGDSDPIRADGSLVIAAFALPRRSSAQQELQ